MMEPDFNDTTSTNPSADDALENARPDKLNASVGQTPLAEDNDSPAAPTPPPDPTADIDYPAQDTGVDSDEKYQEG